MHEPILTKADIASCAEQAARAWIERGRIGTVMNPYPALSRRCRELGMKPTMTYVQSSVLHFMRDYQQQTGSMPTRADIARYFEWKSTNAAEEALQALQRKGYIEIVSNVARGLRFTEQAMVVLRASQPQAEERPDLIALPVINPSRIREAALSRAPGHFRG